MGAGTGTDRPQTAASVKKEITCFVTRRECCGEKKRPTEFRRVGPVAVGKGVGQRGLIKKVTSEHGFKESCSLTTLRLGQEHCR